MATVQPASRWCTGALLLLAASACRESPASVAASLPQTEVLVPAVPPPAPRSPVPVDLPSLAPLVEAVLPTVVSVDLEGSATSPSEDEEEGEEEAPLPEGHPPVPGHSVSREHAGAGVLLGGHGLVLTSFHLLHAASSLLVHLADGRVYEAEVVGRDAPTDLALLRMRHAPKGLPAAQLGDSQRLRTGDWVLAVGNPFGLSSSVSLGVVSGRGRNLGSPYADLLQTDAAINPGNSGGPLFNLQGEVVGIATAVQVAAGIGFAVPSSVVRELLPQLEKEGGVTRGALGAFFQDLTPALGRALGVSSGQGALLSGFTPNSAAERAGLRRDDVVVALDGQPVTSQTELLHSVALRAPASQVKLTLVRGGTPQDVQVTLGTRTDLEGTGPFTRAPSDERPTSADAGLGLELTDLTPELAARLGVRGQGAVVVGVVPGSPADAAGFSVGLVVTEFGGTQVRSARDAASTLKATRPGSTVLVRVLPPGGGPQLRALVVP